MVTLFCLTCKQPFEVKPYRVSEAKYCSIKCRNLAYKKDSNIDLICDHCGKQFTCFRSRLTYGRGKHCSPKCQYEARRSQEKSGETRECLNCHGLLYVVPNKANGNRGTGKYCCRKCRDEHWKGENTPNYINGNKTNWHGPNWYSQRRKALTRDNNTCQKCKMTREESVVKFGQVLVVHHIIPFRMFEGDYKMGNQLRNLVTLCHSCHRSVESYIKTMIP